MRRLSRYWQLWRTLPDDERRIRRDKLVDRLLRQRPGVRRLGLAPDPPRRGALRKAFRVPLEELVERLGSDDPRRGPLFAPLDPRVDRIVTAHPGHVRSIARASQPLLDGTFDLLGSGPGKPLRPDGGIDWHRDWKSGRDWPADVYYQDLPMVRGDGSDIKLPWELSRFQHLLVLGQAYRFAARAASRPGQGDASPGGDGTGGLALQEGLARRCAAAAREQIDDWISTNPRGVGVNWICTMDVALRAVGWIAALGLFRGAPELDRRFLTRVVSSLWVHGRHIRRNLEIGGDGLTSNHYLSDVVGLYAVACALPELRESERWRDFGRAALATEIRRQVLPDGCDFERSIPYHRLVAELFLLGGIVSECAGETLPADYRERLARMLEFTAAYTRPDGSAPQWGDNDDGRLLPLSGYGADGPHDHRHLLAVGGTWLGRPDLVAAANGCTVDALWLLGDDSPAGDPGSTGDLSRGFEASGYYVLRGDDLHGCVPCGPVGTGGLGNHTHNDLFSLCIWADGVEWIPDPGTGSYSSDFELRNRMRGTAAHGTLQIGTREQNRFGDGVDDLFTMQESARPVVEDWVNGGRRARLQASHRGFGDAAAERVHRRVVRFDADQRTWCVVDRTEGATAADGRVLVRFPLAPAIEARVLPFESGGGDGEDGSVPPRLSSMLDACGGTTAQPGVRLRFAVRLDHDGRRLWIGFDLPPGSTVDLLPGLHSPRYGVVQPTRVVTASVEAGPAIEIRSVVWSPVRENR